MVKKFIVITGMVLLVGGTQSMANELDELGSINIVDESSQSSMFQKEGSIVGCNDSAPKKELTCSKKPQEVILSKLPTSQQLDTKDLTSPNDMSAIKTQLLSIVAQLSQLKQQQEDDRNTIQQLNDVIEVLSNKKIKSPSKKMATVKKDIEKIKPKKSDSTTTTKIRKEIKEIERYDNYVIVQVQSNESLSTYAQYYYNDNTKYYRIYKANKDTINKNFQLIVGTKIKIPLN